MDDDVLRLGEVTEDEAKKGREPVVEMREGWVDGLGPGEEGWSHCVFVACLASNQLG